MKLTKEVFNAIASVVNRYPDSINVMQGIRGAIAALPESAVNVPDEWIKWMDKYPDNNGLYCIITRQQNESWVAYWNNSSRRFEEVVPDFTEKGIDVTHWKPLPQPPAQTS